MRLHLLIILVLAGSLFAQQPQEPTTLAAGTWTQEQATPATFSLVCTGSPNIVGRIIFDGEAGWIGYAGIGTANPTAIIRTTKNEAKQDVELADINAKLCKAKTQ